MTMSDRQYRKIMRELKSLKEEVTRLYEQRAESSLDNSFSEGFVNESLPPEREVIDFDEVFEENVSEEGRQAWLRGEWVESEEEEKKE